jgi:hypothetical protein
MEDVSELDIMYCQSMRGKKKKKKKKKKEI